MTGRKIVPLSALLAFLFLAAGLFFLLRNGGGDDSDGWKGYHVILVPEEQARSGNIPRLLDEQGLGPVLSAETVFVKIADFAEGRELSLLELGDQLYDGDPRKDPFLETLPRMFRNDDYRFYWIRDTHPARIVQKKLAGLDIPGAWIPESGTSAVLPGVGLLVLCAVLHVLFSPRSRWALFPTLIPGIALAAAGGNYLTLTGFLLCYSGMHLLPPGNPLRRDPLLLPVGGSLLLGGYFFVRGMGFLPALLIMASLAAAFLAVRFIPDPLPAAGPVRFRNPRVTEHPLFEPVFIGKKPPRKARQLSLSHLAGIGIPVFPLLVIAMVLLSRTGHAPRFSPPWPVPVGMSRPLVPDAIAEVLSTDEKPLYPDAAGYLAHRFYQEGLLYGVGWGSPFIKFSNSISTFSESGGRIVKSPGIPLSDVPDDWSGYLRNLDEDPLFALFRRQGGLVGVGLLEGPSGPLFPYRWWDCLFLWLLAVLSGLPFFKQVLSGKINGFQGRFAAAWRKS